MMARLWRRVVWLWLGVVWEVATVMGREERAAYEEDWMFADVLGASPYREDPHVVSRGRHRGEEVSQLVDHVGRHRAWYDPADHLAPWRA
jgi:hypothetical protein